MSQSHSTVLAYEPTICAFIDVLGFSALVKAKDNRLETYFSLISAFSETWNDQKSLIRMMAISDSIIFTCPYKDFDPQEDPDEVGDLRILLEIIGSIQMILADNGFWTRGGISIGSLCLNTKKNIIVGDAFIKAMELEKTSKFPRVVVDNELVKAFHFQSIRHMIESINKFKNPSEIKLIPGDIIFDYKKHQGYFSDAEELVKDRPMFVDFGSALVHQRDSKMSPKIANHLRKDISAKIEHFEKYRWLAKYLSLKARRFYDRERIQVLQDFANEFENII